MSRKLTKASIGYKKERIQQKGFALLMFQSNSTVFCRIRNIIHHIQNIVINFNDMIIRRHTFHASI